MKAQAVLVRAARDQCLAAIALVRASLEKLPPYDARRAYTPDELEPYDALADRFVRAVETSIRFFRSYERYREAVVSETYRDLLHRMEKYGLISSTSLWVEMRDVRNRIVHDYLPTQLEELFALLLGDYGQELLRLAEKVRTIRWEDED